MGKFRHARFREREEGDNFEAGELLRDGQRLQRDLLRAAIGGGAWEVAL